MIDEVFQLVNFISDKNGRGYLPPAKFNLLAKVSQLEFVTKRLGSYQGQKLPSGYRFNRKVDIDLRPFLYGPETIPINQLGNFVYPYNFMWPDSFHKLDYTPINEVDEDEYPRLKTSHLLPPTSDDPIIIFRNPYGFIDPYGIQFFQMTYIKYPQDPVWGYDVVNDENIYNESKSQDFVLRQVNLMDITALILEKVGLFLDKQQLFEYAQLKQQGA